MRNSPLTAGTIRTARTNLRFDLFMVWTANANQLAEQTGWIREGFVNAPGQTNEVGIRGANHDAKVSGLMLAMESLEMMAVVGQQNARFILRMGENLVVGPSLVGTATFKHGDRIVPKTPQLMDHRQREILVGEEPGYAQSPSLHSFSRMSRAISSGCEPA